MEEKTYQVSRVMAITILIVLSLLQLSDWANRSILAISLQAIKKSFDLTDTQAGLLPSLLQVGVAVFLIPTAFLADRLGRRKVIMGMALIWSIFTVITGLAGKLWHLLLARFMVGTGEAGYQPAGQTWLGLTFSKEIRTRIIAIFMMCMPIGGALGLFLGGLMLNITHDWRPAFFIFGFPGILLAFITFFLPDYKAPRAEGEGVLSKAFFRQLVPLLKIKSYWLFMASSTFLYFLFFAVQAWVPTLIMRAYNLNPLSTGKVLGAIGLLNIFAPVAGFLADGWQKRNKVGRPLFLLVGTFITLALILVSLFLVTRVPFTVYLPFYLVGALAAAFLYPVLIVLVHDVVPVPVRSTAIGFQMTISQLLGGVLGPIVVGVVSDATGGGAQGIVNGLYCTIPVAALSIITTLILIKYYAADSACVSDEVLAEC
jgi:MFS family permease